MRVTCEAAVIDRAVQPQPKCRLIKSIISLGYHSSDQQNTEMFLLHENQLKKSGQRYRVALNIDKVFTKFLNEGKATISFKEPPHDLLIQCDKIRLMAFMSSLRMGLSGDPNFNKSQKTESLAQPKLNGKKLPPLKDTPFTLKNHVNRKMAVKKRSELDKGIPRTVEDLTISDLGLHRFPSNILRLQNLSAINLSENNLTELPAGFGSLPLRDINFAQNKLENSNFAWLKQDTIRMSLTSINLSENRIRHFPRCFLKLPKLKVIKLSNNEIERVPFAIRALKNLRELHINRNKLASLPDALRWIFFDVVDISDNPFQGINVVSREEMVHRICVRQNINLTEICLRRVVECRLPYTAATLPRSLIDVLDETPLCSCGTICFATPIIERWREAPINSSSTVKTSLVTAYADGTLCSLKCVKRYS
ncbi:hypothetical protein HA402_004821 [Bradysia odoriphaga]|nr:hypothetical protein HA402_004821 [Bradysia odoriphaga]